MITDNIAPHHEMLNNILGEMVTSQMYKINWCVPVDTIGMQLIIMLIID